MQFSKFLEYIGKGMTSLKENGVRDTAKSVKRVFIGTSPISLKKWFSHPLYSKEELAAQREDVFERSILFSIVVPLYNTDEPFIKEMIDSVIAQTYQKWELCLADGSDVHHDYVGQICMTYATGDARIKYRKLAKNLGIVGNSNAAIEMAEGEFICLLDHDDILHPAALHDVMKAICEQNADFVYTDELTFMSPKIKDVIHINFKPDFSPDMLLSNNYICHFTCFKRLLLNTCEGFREGFEGSQDHDLFLRLTKQADKIVHVPEVLYFWRATNDSMALDSQSKPYCAVSGRKAILDFLHTQKMEADVFSLEICPTMYRIDYKTAGTNPKVSIVIPTCDHVDVLYRCLSSLKEKTTYSNYEVILVENNSKQAETFSFYEKIQKKYPDIKLVTWPGKGFNWSAINNYAIRNFSTGEYILLLNNDTEIITSDWLEKMMMYGQRKDVGVVGAMLYYPDDRIQHAGVIMGMGGLAGHAFAGQKRGAPGYMGRTSYVQNYSAVTGACMLIRRSVFDEVDGIEEQLGVSFNDVDLCLKVRRAGYLIVWTPYAELYHHEKASRGKPDTKEKKEEFIREHAFLLNRWRDMMIEGDPYFNPNLSLKRSDFCLCSKQGTRKKEYDFAETTKK